MKTHDGLAYAIIELYRATYKTTDSLDIRLVKRWIQEYRAFLLKQKLSRPLEVLDLSYVQHLGLLELEAVNASTDPSIDLFSEVLVTVANIPEPIENNQGKYAITRLALPDLRVANLSLYSYEHAARAGHGRFNKREIFLFLYNGKIYLKCNDDAFYLESTTHLEVSGIFQDPYDAGYTSTDRYPITESLFRDITHLIVTEKFPYKHAPLKDNVADDSDNVVNIKREE